MLYPPKPPRHTHRGRPRPIDPRSTGNAERHQGRRKIHHQIGRVHQTGILANAGPTRTRTHRRTGTQLAFLQITRPLSPVTLFFPIESTSCPFIFYFYFVFISLVPIPQNKYPKLRIPTYIILLNHTYYTKYSLRPRPNIHSPLEPSLEYYLVLYSDHPGIPGPRLSARLAAYPAGYKRRNLLLQQDFRQPNSVQSSSPPHHPRFLEPIPQVPPCSSDS